MRMTDERERTEQDKRLRDRMSRIRYKFIILSGKGGVGKSTVAVNMAYGLAVKGKRVGILDVDMHGPNIAKMLGIEGKRLSQSDNGIEPFEVLPTLKAVSLSLLLENEDQPVIWRGPLKMNMIKQFLADVNWGEIDYLVVDSPPGTGDEPLSVCQLIPGINGAIVVTTPQDVAVLDSRKSIMFAKELKIPVIGVIENMSGLVCPHCKKGIDLFGKGGGEKAASDLNVPFLGRIPLEPGLVKFGDLGKPYIDFQDQTVTAKIMNQILEKAVMTLGQEVRP